MSTETTETKRIKELIALDPIDVAEKMVGKSETATRLGLLIQMDKTKQLNKLLEAGDDTKFSETIENHLKISKDLGFRVVYEEHEEVHNKWESKSTPESYYILWRDDGILMTCDSFCKKQRNSCTFYFNLRKNSPDSKLYDLRVSGHYHDEDRNVWVGSSDGRTALRHQLAEMKKVGDFLPQWIERDFLWISPYWDTNMWDNNARGAELKEREEKRKEKANKRLSALPEDVRRAICYL